MKYTTMTPWDRYGTAHRMITLNSKVFNKLHDYLIEKLKDIVTVQPRNTKDDKDYSFDTASIANGDTMIKQECFTLPLIQNSFLSEDQLKAIKEIFPFHIGNMHFELCTVFDYDYDEERSWQPKIAFKIKETDSLQTKDDQIFIYWET